MDVVKAIEAVAERRIAGGSGRRDEGDRAEGRLKIYKPKNANARCFELAATDALAP